MTDLTQATVAELSSLLSAKKVSSEEVTKAYLQKSKLQKNLMLILTSALKSVLPKLEADKKIAAGEASPLAGVPIAHKDIFRSKEWAKHSCQQRCLRGYMSPFDATVVEKLKEINMVCLGKTNCDEFAMGSTTANSAFWQNLQSLGQKCGSGRFLRRSVILRGSPHCSGRYRYRHRRLHPPAVCFLRRHRH